jgi:hypothetical protein
MRPIAGYSLWIGNTGDLRDWRVIHRSGIVALIDLAVNEQPGPMAREIVYMRVPLIDGAGNAPWIVRAAVETLAGLLRERRSTLVFCGAGMSRSPAVAAGAIALLTGKTCDECLQSVIEGGPADVSPSTWREVMQAVEFIRRRNSLGPLPPEPAH